MYRVVIDENNRIRFSEKLLQELGAQPGSVLICSLCEGILTLRREEDNETPESFQVEMVETELFWLPVEVAYFDSRVRARCKEPYIEVWGLNKEDSIEKFIEKANEFYR